TDTGGRPGQRVAGGRDGGGRRPRGADQRERQPPDQKHLPMTHVPSSQTVGTTVVSGGPGSAQRRPGRGYADSEGSDTSASSAWSSRALTAAASGTPSSVNIACARSRLSRA